MPKRKRRHWNSVESRLHFAKPYVDGFENWLQDHGYTPSTIEERVRLLAGWTDWMHAAGFSLDNILEGLAASVAVFTGKKSIRAYAGAGRLFIRFLQDQGTLPRSAPAPSLAEQWPILGGFRTWARQHRGIAQSTLDLWQRSRSAQGAGGGPQGVHGGSAAQSRPRSGRAREWIFHHPLTSRVHMSKKIPQTKTQTKRKF